MTEMTHTVRRIAVCSAAAIAILAAAVPANAQSVGIRPGVAAYAEHAGFEVLVEGRFRLPLLEAGPGSIAASAFLGYSRVSVDEARKDGFIVAAGAGYEIPFGPAGLSVAPGIAGGVEFSHFTEAATDSEIAPMLLPYVQAGYRFEFGLSVGLQTGLKMLFYTGEAGTTERSLVIGPVLYYAFGG